MHNCDVLLVGAEDQENLGIRSIAAFLEDNGIRAEVQPFHEGAEETVLASIRAKKPGIVGFSLIFQTMFDTFAGLIAFLRKNGVTAHFTVGGHFPTLRYDVTLERIPGLDTVIRHEGELTLLELYRRVEDPAYWKNIRGLAFLRNGKIIVTPPRPLIKNLDTLPFPVRNETVTTIRNTGIVSLIASRGCHFNCSFCSIQKYYGSAPGPRRRSRSPDNVIREMEGLYTGKNVRIFIFKDDDFGMKSPEQQKWIREFAGGLEKQDLGGQFLWQVSCRIDETDQELLKRLWQNGLGVLYLGIESGNEEGLATCNKHYHVRDILESLETVRDSGIHYEYGFMLFDPESTFESVRENIGFLRQITRDGCSTVQFAKMLPYAGTEIESQLRAAGRLKGTIVSPYYQYRDERLDLFEHFVFRTFGRTFGPLGLNMVLKKLTFDAIILDRIYHQSAAADTYAALLRDLTDASNTCILDTLDQGLAFMEERTAGKIRNERDILEELTRGYNKEEAELAGKLVGSVSRYIYADTAVPPLH